MLTQEEIRNIPVVVEVVSVPPIFDVELYLTMRETAGIFEGKETYLEHVKFVSQTIANSPWFILSKCPDITVQSAFLCLELFRQLGLTIDTNYSEAWDSKERGRTWEMESERASFAKGEKLVYPSGHISQRAFVMVVVNLFCIVNEQVMQKVVQKIVEVEDRYEQAQKAQEMIDKK